MYIENLNKYLVSADNFCDQVYVLSTVTNLVNMFQKYFILPCLAQSTIDNSRYYSHLNDKSYFECAMLLIPFLNFEYYNMYIFPRRQFREACRNGRGAVTLKNAEVIRSDRRCVLAAIQQTPAFGYVDNGSKALGAARPYLKDDVELIEIARQVDLATGDREAAQLKTKELVKIFLGGDPDAIRSVINDQEFIEISKQLNSFYRPNRLKQAVSWVKSFIS